MKIIYLSIVFIFIYSLLKAGNGNREIQFEHLTVDDGLSQGVIQDIIQDRRGFIWIATRDGVNRYDGKEFFCLRHEKGDDNSLASNLVYCLTEDSKGRIWIGSNGINCFDPQNGKLIRIHPDPGNPEKFQGGWIYDIACDFDNTIWFASSNGLVHYYPETGKYTTYNQLSQDASGIGSNLVFSVCLTPDHRVFVGTDQDPVFEFIRAQNRFKPIEYKSKYQGNNIFKKIVCDGKGKIYITSENAALHIYDPSSGKSKLVDIEDSRLNNPTIKSILFYSDEEIWLGTDGGGINLYNIATETFSFLASDTHDNRTLSGNAIYKIFRDKDQNIWIGHFGTGLSIWKRNKLKFTSFRNNPLNFNSINKEIVSAVFQDSKGRIWVGQDGGGLSLFHEDIQVFEHFRHRIGDPTSLVSDVILSINETVQGYLLLGTYAKGLMVFDPEKRKVIRNYTTRDGLMSDNIWSIVADKEGNFWILTLRGGISLFNPVAGTFRNLTEHGKSEQLCSRNLITMAVDDKGYLWFGTDDNGICVYNPFNDALIKSYTSIEGEINSLSDNSIRSIYLNERYAWIATNGGGLNRLDMDRDSFKIYTIRDGLPSNALMGILADGNDNLWISSTRGLIKFNMKNGQIVNFDVSDGIQGSEFKYNAQCSIAANRMAFGGVNGLTIFNPDSIKFSQVKPCVAFVDFQVLGNSVFPDTKGSPLIQDIDFVESIILSHKQSTFGFTFVSLDYNSPENNRYMYKMEGFDKDWIDGGNNHHAGYANLPPGKYVFMFKGSNSDGIWSDSAREIKIRIKPPWYRTNLVIILITILIGYFIWHLYRRQKDKRDLRDNQILQQKIDEAEKQLQGKIDEIENQKQEINKRDRQDQEIRFFTDGIAGFNVTISGQRRNLGLLCEIAIAELVKYVGASLGAIYLIDDEKQDQPVLIVKGSYNCTLEKIQNAMLHIGEAYPGTCFYDKQTISVDDLPDNYAILSSGLGKIALRHLILVPMIENGQCCGVIEIASMERLDDFKIRFVEKIAESLASTITIIQTNEKYHKIISDKPEHLM